MTLFGHSEKTSGMQRQTMSGSSHYSKGLRGDGRMQARGFSLVDRSVEGAAPARERKGAAGDPGDGYVSGIGGQE